MSSGGSVWTGAVQADAGTYGVAFRFAKFPDGWWSYAALDGGCATGFQREFREPKVEASPVAPTIADLAPAEDGEIELARGTGITPNTFYVRSRRPNGELSVCAMYKVDSSGDKATARGATVS